MRVHPLLPSGLLALLLAAPAVAGPVPAPRLDRGLAAIEAGAPVPPANRPLPFPQLQRRLTGDVRGFATPLDYAEPAEFGVLIEYDGSRTDLEAAGIRVGTQAGRVFTARVRREEIAALRAVPGVSRVRLARYLQPDLDVSAVDVTADLEHEASGTPPVYGGRAGAGIIVGDVDTGIDFTNGDFLGGDGKTRILYIWDQEDATGTNPAEFDYGSEWTKAQIDDTPAVITHEDSYGHGTNVVGVMAGNGSTTGCSMPAYRYVGIAPEAHIIAVKTDMSDVGILDGGPVRFFTMGANEWRAENEWPPAGTRYTPYYLQGQGKANSATGDGVLAETAPAAGKPDSYVADPDNPVPSVGGTSIFGKLKAGPFDQRVVESRDDVLVYTTAPLAGDTEVTGPVKLVLYASSSARDTDFAVKLAQVRPDGTSVNVQSAVYRASNRESLLKPAPLEKDRVYKFEIEVGNTSMLFKKGHRIRLQIAGSNFPEYGRNLQTGEDNGTTARTGTRYRPRRLALPSRLPANRRAACWSAAPC